MYLITAFVATLISGILWFFFRNRTGLHLEVLTIAFGAATLMWMVDGFFSLAGGEGFISFDDPKDGWIALWTVLGGLFFWLLLSFILNNKEKKAA